MKEFLLLSNILRKQTFRSLIAQQMGGSGRSSGRLVALSILLAFGALCILGYWCAVVFGLMYGLQVSGIGMEIGLMLLLAAAMIMTLVFCVASILGNLFFSRDIPFLAALPLRGTTIFAVKITRVYITELLVSSALAAPALIIYGILSGSGILFYLNAAAVLLFLPMLPLAFATIISLVMSHFSSLTRHRDKLLIVLGVALTLVFVIGQQLLSASLNTMEFTERFFADLFANNGGIFEMAGNLFPPARFAAAAASLGSGAAAGWALYLSISLAALIVALLIASRTYLNTALRTRESARKNIKLKISALKSSSPLKAFAVREMRNVTRSVTYAMNCLIGAIMFPLMLGIMPLTIVSAEMGISGGMAAQLNALRGLTLDLPANIMFIIAYGVSLFILMTNIISGTAISREGDGLWQLKVLPLSYRTMAYGKLLFGVIVNVLTLLLSGVVVCVLLPALIPTVAPAVLIACIASVVPAAVSLMVDLTRPKLKWQSEAEAVKQNLNAVIGMFISLGVALVFCIPIALTGIFLGFIPAIIAAFILSTATAWLSLYLLGNSADRNLSAIEA